ncbi:MAG: alpha/beta fold hydrolase [Clostridia bacterium]|nr:alpha/beta fold hydrolase [Clostridia bacterium]
MAAVRGKRKYWLIAAAILAAAMLTELVLTALIYGSMFSRYEGAPAEPPAACREQEFMSRGDKLKGRLFDREGASGLVVLVPGLHMAQTELYPVAAGLLESGYAVFTFDAAGEGESEGSSPLGFPRIADDLRACVEHIEANGLFGYGSICLLGLSRGGYAAGLILSEYDSVSCAVCIGAPDSPTEAIKAGVEKALGAGAKREAWRAIVWQALLFSPKAGSASASEAVKGCGKPILILQGDGDRTVPEWASVYARADEVRSAEALMLPGGHTEILVSGGEANAETLGIITDFLRECGL